MGEEIDMTEQEAKKLVDKYGNAVRAADRAYRIAGVAIGTSKYDEAASEYNYCLLKEEKAHNELVAALTGGQQ